MICMKTMCKSGKKVANEIGAGERHKAVAGYHGDEERWRVMLEEVKPDVVFIATNWHNHAPMAIAAMEQGAHAFVEVPIAVTLEEMWAIVDTSERTRKHCMMMENVNYSRDELMFFEYVSAGCSGAIVACGSGLYPRIALANGGARTRDGLVANAALRQAQR